MMVIGITGGMASGKTTLARMFVGRGIFHFDADREVHRLMRDDPSTLAAVQRDFPQAVEKGVINRSKLAGMIVKEPSSLAKLEAILHPYVRAAEIAFIARARRQRARAVILDIPLLFETDANALCDVTLVAHAPKALRRRRAFARLGMTEEKWRRLLDRQLPDHARMLCADIVVPTSLSQAVTRRMVIKLMKRWKLL